MEGFYRHSGSTVVRSTHMSHRTGSCSPEDIREERPYGEIQQTDYPETRPHMPNHEPRVPCGYPAVPLQRQQWIKYPLIRGHCSESTARRRRAARPGRSGIRSSPPTRPYLPQL
ncbi:MAG: hypothetical protein H6545_00070 [Bacteroidales bacterium]|nr:hypothetical protein [Bacteroidales bacterium]